MSDQLVWFETEVSATGYKLTKHPGCCYESSRGPRMSMDGHEKVLIANVDEHGDMDLERRRPLQETGLFRTFAALQWSDQSSIVDFANEFGTLTNGVILVYDFENSDSDEIECQGEPLIFWINEIRKVSTLLALWDAMQEGRSTDIDAILESSPAGVRFRDPHSAFGTEIIPISRPDFLWDVPSSYELARSMARGGLGSSSRDRARAVVSSLINRELALGTAVRLGQSGQNKKDVKMRLVPRDLRAALWLQFARSISAGKKYHQCEDCARFFEIEGPEGARADSRFCNDACRARNWRRNRAAERPHEQETQ